MIIQEELGDSPKTFGLKQPAKSKQMGSIIMQSKEIQDGYSAVKYNRA